MGSTRCCRSWQMPRGAPVGTMAIGAAGATNAALYAGQILALSDPALADRLAAWRAAPDGGGGRGAKRQ